MSEMLLQKELAERLGISARTVRKHSNAGRIPRNQDGSYPWPEARDAFLQLKIEAEGRRSAGFGGESYEAARARKVAAQARLAELQVLEREGQLIAAADVEGLLRAPLERVDVALKGVPSRHGPRLAKAAGITLTKAKAILSEIAEGVRAELREVPDAA